MDNFQNLDDFKPPGLTRRARVCVWDDEDGFLQCVAWTLPENEANDLYLDLSHRANRSIGKFKKVTLETKVNSAGDSRVTAIWRSPGEQVARAALRRLQRDLDEREGDFDEQIRELAHIPTEDEKNERMGTRHPR